LSAIDRGPLVAIDTEHRIATPEGVELTLRVAGPVPRALAWLLDLAWRAGVLFALLLLLMPFGGLGTGVFLIMWFVLEWLVPAAFEAAWQGATPGKKALGLMVVRDDGAPVGWGPALTRNLLRFADFLPLAYLVGLLAMLGNRQFKRLGDLVAGTLVIHGEPRERMRAVASLPPLAPPRALSAEQARSVLDFAERAAELGSARAEELAQVAGPLLDRRDGAEPARTQLERMAVHLSGAARVPAAAAATVGDPQ
jgi:uncharacterized RDD family membrane protein YckC